MLRGIIFDIDGTLLDSNDAHAHCWVQAMRESGHVVLYELVRELIGASSERILHDACGLSPDDGAGKIIAERKDELFANEHLARCMATPGARALLKELRGRGLALTVATSSSDARALLEQAGVADLFESAVTADDVDLGKPAPDVVTAALQKLGMPASDVVLIGDTPYDIEAAQRAGVRTIAMRTGGWFDAELTGAAAVVDDPRDLLLRLDVLYRLQPFTGAPAAA